MGLQAVPPFQKSLQAPANSVVKMCLYIFLGKQTNPYIIKSKQVKRSLALARRTWKYVNKEAEFTSS